jgi:hypothetical protein
VLAFLAALDSNGRFPPAWKVVMTRNVVLVVLLATLTATTLTGCGQAPKPAPVAAPTDAAAARGLVQEPRAQLEQAPSLAGWAVLEALKVKPPATLSDVARSAAKATGRTLWLPSPSVVGTPSVVVDYSRGTVGFPARKLGFAAQYPDRAVMFTAGLVSDDPTGGLRAPSSDASYGGKISRYVPGGTGPRWTRITVRGNPGVAFMRGAPSEMSKPLRGAPGPEPSFVEWAEGGVRYQFMSYQLDPDQLLAVAGSMAQVKP